jgi:hypothetical protein
MTVAKPSAPNVDYALTLMSCWARNEKPGGPGRACQLAEQSILYLRVQIEQLTRERDLWKERHDRERAAHAKNLTEQQKCEAERDRLREALERIRSIIEGKPQYGDGLTAYDIARKALRPSDSIGESHAGD